MKNHQPIAWYTRFGILRDYWGAFHLSSLFALFCVKFVLQFFLSALAFTLFSLS